MLEGRLAVQVSGGNHVGLVEHVLVANEATKTREENMANNNNKRRKREKATDRQARDTEQRARVTGAEG